MIFNKPQMKIDLSRIKLHLSCIRDDMPRFLLQMPRILLEMSRILPGIWQSCLSYLHLACDSVCDCIKRAESGIQNLIITEICTRKLKKLHKVKKNKEIRKIIINIWLFRNVFIIVKYNMTISVYLCWLVSAEGFLGIQVFSVDFSLPGQYELEVNHLV